MELVQRALSLYRRRHFTECAELCEQEPSSKQLQWLGMLALTQHAWLDELELEGLQSLAEELLDNQATAQTGRPGTSLRAPPPPTGGGRPMTREGRPLTGLRRRPRSRTATQQGVERALYTAGGRTARPTTAAPAAVPEFGRLGAAASGWPDKPWLSKPLFRFLYHQRGDVRQHAYMSRRHWSWPARSGQPTAAAGGHYSAVAVSSDWACCARPNTSSGRRRKPETRSQGRSSGWPRFSCRWISHSQLWKHTGVVWTGFRTKPLCLAPMARVYEALHDLQRSAKLYRELLSQDAVNVEAIACVATHHFYADQPEMALRFYRRLLQLGMPTAELYNNLALCCFYAQQYDMALACFDRALALAEDQNLADVWYNLGLVALSSGDKTLATRAFRLALVYDNCHAESYNNLGVLELTSGNVDQAAAYFATAGEMAPELCEAHYNHALVLERGSGFCRLETCQGCARAASKCSQHAPSADLLQKVQAFFQSH
ncbi:hypothetical protein MRX96_025157 [Rhipicephalus microplus]